MKQITSFLLLLVLSVANAYAAEVRLAHLRDFDTEIHKIAVNTQVEVTGNCFIDPAKIGQAYKVLLGHFGFSVAEPNESQLEFAVSIKGFGMSASQPCGVKVLSMVRQIPEIKMLRLPPGSNSTRYRLWTMENVITTSQREIQAMLENEARKDITAFARYFKSLDD